MRHREAVLVIGFGLGMLQGCAASSVPSYVAGATERAAATDVRMENGTMNPAQVGIANGQVRQYLERQVRPGTTLRFR